MRAPGAEQVEVHPAPPRLRAWAPCLILRRVAGMEPAVATVHANTFACLNVVARGRIEVDGQWQAARFLAGPLSRPRKTLGHGALSSASLVLQPWVIEPWLGLRIDHLAGRLVDAAAAPRTLDGRLCDALATACDDPPAIHAVWDALEAVALATPAPPPELAVDVLAASGVEAAAAASGCSGRQYRRRFRRAFGLAPAAWIRVRRWEASLQALLDPAPGEALAGLAAQFGYADQAHLARDTRAFVQGTPGRLRGAAAGEGLAWSLAPARVRILQDGAGGAP